MTHTLSPQAKQSTAVGEARKLVGMELAAARKEWHIQRDTLAFLDALATAPGNVATLDDAAADLMTPYADNGKWRGSIPRRLALEGLIRKTAVAISVRAARHRGYVSQWQGVDLDGINAKRESLRRWLAANPEPDDDSDESGDNGGFLFCMDNGPADDATGPQD